MADYRTIPIMQLLVDTENPRLVHPEPSQLESIRAMVRAQKSKIINLAKDILDNGLNPSDTMIVTRANGDKDRYFVLEGNRRLCALKVLENPDLVIDLFSGLAKKQLREMSTAYQETPVSEVSCAVVDDREDARHWIELRHGGEQAGAGIVRWGAAETARFRQRYGQKEIHLQVLDFLEEQGMLTPEERRGVPVTSLKRVVQDRHTRDRLGYDIEEGRLEVKEDPPQLARILKRIVADLSTGKKKTKDIYHKEDRVKYVDDLFAEQQQIGSMTDGVPSQEQVSSANETSTSSASVDNRRKRNVPLEKNRSFLIPKRVKLVIPQDRVNEIYYELRKLLLHEYPNAIAVLFRVFIELSVDVYISDHQADFTKKPEDITYRLNKKLEDVANHLKMNGKLTENQVKAVRRAAQKDHFIATTITTMNQYVHNAYFKPSLDDLRTAWDNLERFISAIWS